MEYRNNIIELQNIPFPETQMDIIELDAEMALTRSLLDGSIAQMNENNPSNTQDDFKSKQLVQFIEDKSIISKCIFDRTRSLKEDLYLKLSDDSIFNEVFCRVFLTIVAQITFNVKELRGHPCFEYHTEDERLQLAGLENWLMYIEKYIQKCLAQKKWIDVNSICYAYPHNYIN